MIKLNEISFKMIEISILKHQKLINQNLDSITISWKRLFYNNLASWITPSEYNEILYTISKFWFSKIITLVLSSVSSRILFSTVGNTCSVHLFKSILKILQTNWVTITWINYMMNVKYFLWLMYLFTFALTFWITISALLSAEV